MALTRLSNRDLLREDAGEFESDGAADQPPRYSMKTLISATPATPGDASGEAPAKKQKTS